LQTLPEKKQLIVKKEKSKHETKSKEQTKSKVKSQKSKKTATVTAEPVSSSTKVKTKPSGATKPQTSNLKPQTSNLKPQTSNPKPPTSPKPKTKDQKPKTTTPKPQTPNSKLQTLFFQVRFKTGFGQQICILGDAGFLGGGDVARAVPMEYFDEEHWYAVIEAGDEGFGSGTVTYNYLLKNADGTVSFDWGKDKKIDLANVGAREVICIDAWNFAGYYENSFYTEPFRRVLLPQREVRATAKKAKKPTHVLRIKTPWLGAGQTLCVIGNCEALGHWDIERAIMMQQPAGEDFYELQLDLTGEIFPIAYKYGVYDSVNKTFVRYEDGNNRVLHDAGAADRLIILNDGWAQLPGGNWKGAGIAIPVFSLRSENSFGIGEFSDMKLLVDWAEQTGLRMIQLLPVNDTTATHTWTDSYPYAAISAFALHPIYLNLSQLGDQYSDQLKKLETERLRLNALETVDYVAVAKIKLDFVRKIFGKEKEKFLANKDYLQFFEQNKHWLVPYAAFCYLRDEYGTVEFARWPQYQTYDAAEIGKLSAPHSEAFAEIALHYFIQYHLHLQLKAATAYAHAKGIIVKGDIAIGVYRNGADAWQSPELYHLEMQAGAPPDDFAVTGQNWGFPTYNWQRMREDGFAWWKQRFAQMSYYFDAFRIDHILGFFRIWSIPMHAVEGIMGHFVPAIPVHIQEFHQRNTWFDLDRFTKPYITENVLWELFGYDNELVKSLFLQYDGFGNYTLRPEYSTQRLVEAHFELLDQDAHHLKIRQGLYNLLSNVILFEAEEGGQSFHFRFGMEQTSSFRALDESTRHQLKELYVDYYFRRQDDFWMKEALQKLPALKRETNMLVCGEDLGMVPSCVPEVMRQLGLLSLEIQRMPKNPATAFFHPNDAPYLSVVTPSTHDMSTIRGWWEEDRERIQRFYNNELGQWGEAPVFCEAWINKAIVVQHLHSPAMWSVFQLQDLLGMDAAIRRAIPSEERINIPAEPKHYWRYRMHLSLENLLEQKEFNDSLREMVVASGRSH
jgi:4-alpha-glucanotransferase